MLMLMVSTEISHLFVFFFSPWFSHMAVAPTEPEAGGRGVDG